MFSLLRSLLGSGSSKKTDDLIVLTISDLQLKALISKFDDRFSVLETRIKRCEGDFGKQIQMQNAEIKELEAENDELESKLGSINDITAKRQQMIEVAPGVIESLNIDVKQKAELLAGLTDPKAQESIDAVIKKFFPDVPVTSEGLLKAAPIILKLMEYAKAQQKPKSDEDF
jgi:hypothetical protein